MLAQPKIELRGWVLWWLRGRRRVRAASHSTGPTVPGAPQSLALSNIGAALQLDWLQASGTVIGYKIYRKVDAGGYSLFRTVGVNGSPQQDATVVDSHTYYYYLTAYNGIGESAPSNVVSMLFIAA